MWKGIFNEEKEGKEMGKKAEKTLPSNNVFGLYSLQRQVPHNKLPGPGLLGCRKEKKTEHPYSGEPDKGRQEHTGGNIHGSWGSSRRGKAVYGGY